jgi:cellulose synthase/poly-beta-1,6-N-acetylglucosamine synthase-like glycosyltransferase
MAADAPEVSVVMPARNAERLIDEAIQSVQAQTLRSWELIVVDDRSTDGTAALVTRHASSDSRIRLVPGPGRGVSAARNAGLQHARGRWTAMLDADDIACPDRLELQVRFLESNRDVVGVASRAFLFVTAGKPIGLSAVTRPTDRAELAAIRRSGELLVLCHSAVMWRSDRLSALGGFDERFHQAEDTELVNRAVHLHGWAFLLMPRPVVWYRLTTTGLSMQGLRLQRQVLRYLETRNACWARQVDPPSLDWFLERPLDHRTRLRRWRHDMGAILYRLAGVRVGAGSWPEAVAPLFGAALLHPRYVAAKAWKQRFSRSARDAFPSPLLSRGAP